MFMHYVGDWEMPVKLDAPVSGSIIAAEAGTLTFMVMLRFCYCQTKVLVSWAPGAYQGQGRPRGS